MNGDIILGVILGVIILATIIGIAEAIGVGDFNATCHEESDLEDTRW